MTATDQTHKSTQRALTALILLVPFPTLGVIVAMYLPGSRGSLFGQGFYFFTKLWILALPIIWLRWVDKTPISWSPPKRGGFGLAILSGLLIGALIYGAFLLFGLAWIDTAYLREQAVRNGIGKPINYIVYVSFLSLINALLEEYVWRWFTYRQCKAVMSTLPAMLATALFFTSHHILALNAQFDWRVTLTGSIGVFSGSLIWSWLYQRYQSIWPGYVSHVILDAAIFLIGWRLLFS